MGNPNYKLALEKISEMGCEYGKDSSCAAALRPLCRSCLATLILRGPAPAENMPHTDDQAYRRAAKQRAKYRQEW